MRKFRVGWGLIEIANGSILNYPAEALVTPTTHYGNFYEGSQVQMAIRSIGGPQIFRESREAAAWYFLQHPQNADKYPGLVPPCIALSTTAGKLSAKRVIHAVGSNLHPDKAQLEDKQEDVKRVVLNVLETAENEGLTSIGFPVLGTELCSSRESTAFLPANCVESMLSIFSSYLMSTNSVNLQRVGLVTPDEDLYRFSGTLAQRLTG